MREIQGVMERNVCSGAFLLLDATVNPALPDAADSRAGIYLIKNAAERRGFRRVQTALPARPGRHRQRKTASNC